MNDEDNLSEIERVALWRASRVRPWRSLWRRFNAHHPVVAAALVVVLWAIVAGLGIWLCVSTVIWMLHTPPCIQAGSCG